MNRFLAWTTGWQSITAIIQTYSKLEMQLILLGAQWVHCVRALVLWDQSVRDMPVPSNACVTNFLFLVSWLMVMPKAASQVLVRLTCGMRCRWKITIGMRLMLLGTTRSWRELTIIRKFLEVRAISGSCWGRMTRLLLASPLQSRIPITQ